MAVTASSRNGCAVPGTTTPVLAVHMTPAIAASTADATKPVANVIRTGTPVRYAARELAYTLAVSP